MLDVKHGYFTRSCSLVKYIFGTTDCIVHLTFLDFSKALLPEISFKSSNENQGAKDGKN